MTHGRHVVISQEFEDNIIHIEYLSPPFWFILNDIIIIFN